MPDYAESMAKHLAGKCRRHPRLISPPRVGVCRQIREVCITKIHFRAIKELTAVRSTGRSWRELILRKVRGLVELHQYLASDLTVNDVDCYT